MILKEQFRDFAPFILASCIFYIIMNAIDVDSTTLMRAIPLFLMVNFFIILTCLAMAFNKIRAMFKDVKRKTWIFLLLILVLSLAIRLHTPLTHRLYFDEDIYLNIAQNIANDGRAILCNRGSPEHCEEGILNKQPQGLSFFLAGLFLFTDANERAAQHLMILISVLSTGALFLFVYLLTKAEEPALYSALILALTPIHAIWAPTITGENLFVFFALLSMTAILAHIQHQSRATLFLAISLLAYTTQLRPEAPLLLPVAGLFFIKKRLNKDLLAGFVVFLILFSPYVLQFKNVSDDNWGASSEKFDLQYFVPNSKVNSTFFIENTRYPLFFTIFALPGIAYLLTRKQHRALSALLLWFALFFFIYTLFYAGSFNYGVDVRFSMMLYPALSSLIGIGMYYARLLTQLQPALMILISLVVFSTFSPFVTAVGEESWASRTSHDLAIRAAKEAGSNCTVFTHVPSMFLVNGNSALQTWMASNNDIVHKIFKETDCVLFDEGYWCVTVDRFKRGVCQNIKSNYLLQTIDSATEHNTTFTLYKLVQK